MSDAVADALKVLIDGLDRAKSMLATDGQDYVPRVEDIADMLWLATRIQSAAIAEPRAEPGPEQGSEDSATPPTGTDNRDDPQGTTPAASGSAPPPERSSGEPIGLLSTQGPPQTPETAPVDRLRVPAAAALRQKLDLIRALRPLARRVDSQTDRVIDEEATAIALAEGNPVGIVERPRRERWLDLELVIEQSRIASLWNRAGKEWADLLAGSGLFRSVRVWTIAPVEDESAPIEPLRLASGTPQANADRDRVTRRANPRELIDPTGRRLVMLLSDCLSPRWWNGEIQPVLADWSSQGPMVVVQWFPPKPYWERTALKLGDEVRLTTIAPALPNYRLAREYLGLNPELDLDWFDEDEDDVPPKVKGAIAPVVSLEPKPLRSWARLVAGYGNARVAGRRFELVWDEDHWQGPSKERRQLPESGEQRVKLFGQTASRLAQELAGLMALGPVSPEITNLIQETLLPASTAVHVAEVFLSGLLKETGEGAYEFVEGAKAALRKSMTTVDEQLVFRKLSGFLSERYGLTPREFEAFLLERSAASDGLELSDVEAFAELRKRQGGWSAVQFEPFEITYGEWVPEPVTTVSASAAEMEMQPAPPEIEELEFLVARLEEVPDSETDGEAEPEDSDRDAASSPALPPGVQRVWFDHTVVTLNPDGSERARVLGRAVGFVEHLAEQFALEMVGIPGGEFLMGCPDGENGHDDEKPQHRVTVPPLYLGRYPVTQAQWRFVAGLKKVKRDLTLQPSHFKGADRPVEQVSWDDAAEFCARLSRHTGRAYRLPTEAEWEYACRAGTTTPFHFGETLNTAVANYNGNYTYGNGPQGQYRQETTPVGSLEAANNWGLLDMHGNVWEWCQDDWHGNYKGAPTDGSAWLDRSTQDTRKVGKGGSWINNPWGCRSAFRLRDSRGSRGYDLGFRVACSAPRLS